MASTNRHPGFDPGSTFLSPRFKKAWIPAFAGLTMMVAAPAAAQAPSTAPDYTKDSTWLCLPGRADTCSSPLPTTALNPNGYGSSGQSTLAKDPPIDCFYVYPTVSRDQGMNSDLKPSEEIGMTQVQFTRFAGVCRTFAPLYRQMTLAAVAAYSAGASIDARDSRRHRHRRPRCRW